MKPPLTISGNNRRAGIMYLLVVDIILVALIIIGYLLFQSDQFIELYNSEPIFKYALILSISLSFAIYASIFVWLSVKALQSKSIKFNPNKISYLINEKQQWESDYPHINRVEVSKVINSGQELVKSIDVITITNTGENKNTIPHLHLSQKKLFEIIHEFKDRQIRVVEK